MDGIFLPDDAERALELDKRVEREERRGVAVHAPESELARHVVFKRLNKDVVGNRVVMTPIHIELRESTAA